MRLLLEDTVPEASLIRSVVMPGNAVVVVVAAGFTYQLLHVYNPLQTITTRSAILALALRLRHLSQAGLDRLMHLRNLHGGFRVRVQEKVMKQTCTRARRTSTHTHSGMNRHSRPECCCLISHSMEPVVPSTTVAAQLLWSSHAVRYSFLLLLSVGTSRCNACRKARKPGLGIGLQ